VIKVLDGRNVFYRLHIQCQYEQQFEWALIQPL